jgi:putative membrane-bound dehydrogenase-like protein
MKATSLLLATVLSTGLGSLQAKTPDGKPLVVFIAGKPSHGPGEHEHNAGVQLLAKCLNQGAPYVATKVHLNAEWPSAEEFAQADTVVIYSDGGGGHPALQADHLETLKAAMDHGTGFVCLHYAVEYPADKGGPQALDWMGGFFEANWSVNPHWQADYKKLPEHPVSNGVKPFGTNDEWYFHMRFRGDQVGKLTDVLSAVPPESTMSRKDGPHEGNPTVRAEVAAGKPQTTAWAYERPNGGRGFGFTGGHYHKGWANEDQRRLVLNGILWTAKAAVPADGVESKISDEDLAANLDNKPPRKPAPPKPPEPSAAPPAKPGASSGKPIFESPVVHNTPVPVKVDLRGANELFLVITDGGDGITADWADWAEPTLLCADGTKLKLTDLSPKTTKVGWNTLGLNKNAGGKEMKIEGQPVPFGFGAHAPSLLAFDLPVGVVGFEARGGMDNGGTDQGGGATAVFQVYTQDPGDRPLKPTNFGPAKLEDRYGLEKAKENMDTFKTPDGLQPMLVAAEPMIQNPTSLDIDPSGRIWATECVNYRKYAGLRPEGDRVVILEDTDGDGLADKETTFFQDPRLTNPLGLCVLPGPGGAKKGTQVLVSAAPNLWLLTDTQGNDRADKAEILLTVGGSAQHDHQLHALSFGFDGKFYFNMGNESREMKWPDGTVVTDVAGNRITADGKPYRQGMVFRADLTDGKLKNIETLGWNFRNNYKVAVDSFGTVWQSDNDDDGNKGVRINYVMDYGNYGYTDELTGAGWRSDRTNLETEIPFRHWHLNDPGVIPNLLQTGAGSPTGIIVNEGSALGPQFTNQVIHCDAGPRVVRAYPVEKMGAGYSATSVEILTSNDPWFRPSDAAVAPDGSLFISDWYDPGVGGHGMGDNTPGKIMGRIYRVASTGGVARASAPDFTSAEGAVKALQSPNRSTAYVAWQTLHALGAKAQPALEQLAKNGNPRLRARAYDLLARIPGQETKALTAALSDPDADVRVSAIRQVRILTSTGGYDSSELEDNHAVVGKLMRDVPEVRREIALSLHDAKKIARIWAALAQQYDGKDRWYLEALGIGARGNEDECFDAWLTAVHDDWNTPAGRDIIWRLRCSKTADYLARIISGDSVTAPEKPRFFREFDFLPASPQKTEALVQLASLDGAADEITREALTRLKGTDFSANPKLSAALSRTLDRAKGTPQFITLVRDFRASGQGAALLDTALGIGGDPAAVDAVRMLFAEADADKIVTAALTGPNASKVLDLLGSTATPQGLTLLGRLAADAQSPLRQAAVKALARTQPGAEALIKLARNSQLPADLSATAGSALRLVQYPSLKNDIDQLFPAPSTLGGQSLPPIPELLKLTGDAAKGQAVFERAESSCTLCHRINDKGVDFAPALSEIGSKLPKEAIYDAVLNPNASVTMGFETVLLSTKDGGTGMGIVRSETGDEVVLALPGGATTKFRKGDIVKREKLTTSMMPSGLNQALSKDDLVNLVEYLASLKKK